jgi:hypothetical protein
VGKLKEVAKVWQFTACDASSFAWAQLVIREVTAVAVLMFLTEVVRAGCSAARWRLLRAIHLHHEPRVKTEDIGLQRAGPSKAFGSGEFGANRPLVSGSDSKRLKRKASVALRAMASPSASGERGERRARTVLPLGDLYRLQFKYRSASTITHQP